MNASHIQIPVPDSSFRCLRCGACCRWKGIVKVSEEEVRAIAAFLHIPEQNFIDDYTRLAPDRSTLILLENGDGSCFYYDAEHHACRIQDVKPAQCRAFPHAWRFPGWEKECAGGRLMSEKSPDD